MIAERPGRPAGEALDYIIDQALNPNKGANGDAPATDLGSQLQQVRGGRVGPPVRLQRARRHCVARALPPHIWLRLNPPPHQPPPPPPQKVFKGMTRFMRSLSN
jgi:hypothetical protein